MTADEFEVDREREPSSLPRRLGDYEVLEWLGRGAMGMVHRARHRTTGAQVAIKVCATRDYGNVGCLRQEAEALAALNSASIPRIHAKGEAGGWYWVAMDFLKGRNLRSILAGQPEDGGSFFDPLGTEILGEAVAASKVGAAPITKPRAQAIPLRTLIAWFRDLAQATAALHESKMIHRDIKPENIVVTDEGRAYLIDLGLSATADDPKSLQGELAGTRQYMSPEQASGGMVAVDTETDQYSLALVFLEACIGTPIRQRTRDAVLKEILIEADDLRFLAHLPRSLRPIFRRALMRDADERFGSCRRLAAQLDAWLERRPLEGVAATRSEVLWLWSRRSVLRTALVCLLAVAAIGAAVVASWPEDAGDLAFARIEERILAGDESHALLSEVASLVAAHPDHELAMGVARRAVAEFARPRSRELVFSQRTTLSGRGLHARHVDFARDAESLMKLAPNPDLLFHLALHELLSGRPQVALQRLEGHDGLLPRSPLLIQLHSLLLHMDGRKAEAQRALERGSARHVYGEGLEVCFEAWRLLRVIGWGGRMSAAERDEARQLEVRLSALMDRSREIALARTLRARLRAALSDWEGAIADASDLRADAESSGERAGCLVVLSVASAGLARSESDAQRRGRLLKRSVDHMREAAHDAPEVFGIVSRRLCAIQLPGPDLLRWLELADDRLPPQRLDEPAFYSLVFVAERIAADMAQLDRLIRFVDGQERPWRAEASTVSDYAEWVGAGISRAPQETVDSDRWGPWMQHLAGLVALGSKMEAHEFPVTATTEYLLISARPWLAQDAGAAPAEFMERLRKAQARLARGLDALDPPAAAGLSSGRRDSRRRALRYYTKQLAALETELSKGDPK